MSGMKTDGLMGRNASEKEKTKMRERQRRSITTKIFHGLRKHGGYNLPPRSDINDVLRELAREAGFVVESDGTTYRASSSSFLNSSATTTTTTTTNNNNNVSVDHAFQGSCGIGKRKGSNTPTPTSSFGGGGGDCSSTASPNHVAVCYAQAGGSGGSVGGPTSVYLGAGGASSSRNLSSDHDIPVAHYYGIPYCGALGGVSHLSVTANNNTAAAAVAFNPAAAMMVPHQQLYFQEARASNQNTPVGSPQRRPYQSVDPFSGVGGQKDTGAR